MIGDDERYCDQPYQYLHLHFEVLPGSIAPFDLQRFAAEDEGRTEDPTERKQREERQKGNIPRSQDIPQAAVLIGGALMLVVLGSYMLRQVSNLFYTYLSGDFASLSNFDQADVKRLIFQLFFESGKIAGPIMIGSMIMGVIGNLIQSGFLFTTDPLKFKLERLKPDFKRVLPTRRVMWNLLKIIVQFALIITATWLIVVDDYVSMLRSYDMGLGQAIMMFAWIAFKLLLVAGVILLALSIPDYFYQKFEYMENIKMTTSETKRERKEEEGDPLMRQRQRERGMELRSQRNMLQDVASADVVITNPTHYAVALHFDEATSRAPKVIAKGVDQFALQLRTVARERGVPIEENPPLARALYSEVEVGSEIPETLYKVVSLLFSRLDRFRAGA